MQNKTQVHRRKPLDFDPKQSIAAAYVEVGKELLLLQLSENKKEAKKWGVPAGKLEAEEDPEKAVVRELFEETGISLQESDSLCSLGQLYVRKPGIDYIYNAFRVNLTKKPQVSLSEEHTIYRWLSVEEASKLDLMDGADEALKFYMEATKKRRAGATVNAYLILRKNDDVLLHLRKNTGYCDNYYGLVSGHVEDGEAASAAIIREAQEETGIQLNPLNLRIAHIMHRKTDRCNVDIFFEAAEWQGQIENKEPEKCASLGFCSFYNMPLNTIDYILKAIQAISRKEFYSETGWHDH